MSSQVRFFLETAGGRNIKPSGENLICTCPFHEDTHRSFSMNVTTGQFVCFSQSCGRQGSLYEFLTDACGYTPKKAKETAEEWSSFEGYEEDWKVDFPEWDDRKKEKAVEQPKAEEKLLGLYDFCPKYMLTDRKIEKQFLRKWEIGFDFDCSRVTFPVREKNGDLIGFSKRTTKEEHPKYLHLGFKRSKMLYGEFFLPADAEVWVTEGQIDTIALNQLGVDYPVSTMSAKVGKRQVELLSKYPRVVLAYDNDQDGREASMKVGDGLANLGHREVYVARKFPKGIKDPGDLVRKASLKQQKRFIENLEAYDLVHLDWTEGVR